MKRLLLTLTVILLGLPMVHAQQIRFVFMSDPHYGLEREFRDGRLGPKR